MSHYKKIIVLIHFKKCQWKPQIHQRNQHCFYWMLKKLLIYKAFSTVDKETLVTILSLWHFLNIDEIVSMTFLMDIIVNLYQSL